ncbi:MAG TPA: cyclic nucleotide-binding domain-containing protein [Mariprofundaceae bacterium]|nr:cyclic nucleotide-binding domain-containing protein [Mariprofundaceae bacterium]
MSERLISHSLFKSLSENSLKALTDVSEIRHYKPNEALIEEGQFNDRLFILVKGSVRVESADAGLIGHLKPDSIIGEISTSGMSSPVATVTADEDVEVITIPIETVSEIAFEEDAFANAMRALGMQRSEAG